MKKLYMILLIIVVLSLTGCYSDESNQQGPNAYTNTTWKTTDGYTLELKTDSCQITLDGAVKKNECKFTTNANGSGAGKITICNEYGLRCDDYEIGKDNYLHEQIYLYGYVWYRQ